MYVIEDDHAESLWIKALMDIAGHGTLESPRSKGTLEVTPLTLVLHNPLNNIVTNPYRNVNHAFALAELMWIFKGRNDLEFIGFFNSRMKDYSDDGCTLTGAYGPKFRAQLSHVLTTLQTDRNSRQAVIDIWTPNPKPSMDIPCTLNLHFMIRQGKLNLHVTMRSNDIWLGLPYDMFTFTSIQQLVAEMLGVPIGTYFHTANSMHLYLNNLPDLKWACEYPGELIRGPVVTLDELDNLYMHALSIIETKKRPELHIKNCPRTTFSEVGETVLVWYKRKILKDYPLLAEPYKTLRRNVDHVKEKFKSADND